VDLFMQQALNPELTRFVLKWGAEVTVIAPAKLREEIAATAVKMAALYR
jgi:predicted DNA-binding transcriptional regulator YafY